MKGEPPLNRVSRGQSVPSDCLRWQIPAVVARSLFPCGVLFRNAPLDCLRLRYSAPLRPFLPTWRLGTWRRYEGQQDAHSISDSTSRTDREMHNPHWGKAAHAAFASIHLAPNAPECLQRSWGPEAVCAFFPDFWPWQTPAKSGSVSASPTPRLRLRYLVLRVSVIGKRLACLEASATWLRNDGAEPAVRDGGQGRRYSVSRPTTRAFLVG